MREILRKKEGPIFSENEEFIERKRGGCLDQAVQVFTLGKFGVETKLTHISVMSFPGMNIKEDNPWVVRLPSGKYAPRDCRAAKVSKRIVKNR